MPSLQDVLRRNEGHRGDEEQPVDAPGIQSRVPPSPAVEVRAVDSVNVCDHQPRQHTSGEQREQLLHPAASYEGAVARPRCAGIQKKHPDGSHRRPGAAFRRRLGFVGRRRIVG